MNDFAIFWDWLSFGVRWLHVVTGIAWIGSSFYFVALDLGLRQRPGMPVGAYGEEWQVHGGGFYHMQKYLVAPAEMPQNIPSSAARRRAQAMPSGPATGISSSTRCASSVSCKTFGMKSGVQPWIGWG